MDATADQGGTSGRPAENLARRHSATRRARPHKHKRRRWALAALAGTLAPIPSPATDARAATVVAGVCEFTFRLSSPVPVELLPLEKGVSWTITGLTGTCQDTDTGTDTYEGSIAGSLHHLVGKTATCLGGVMTGTVTVDANAEVGPIDTFVVAVMAGPSLTMAGSFQTTFVGAGTFYNEGLEVTECTADGWTETTWKGYYAFVDPTL